MNQETHAIMDVFHAYARTEEEDTFARSHVHGLNKDYVILLGFASEAELVEEFKSWLSSKPYIALFANGAHKEAQMLNMTVCDFNLAPWAERQHHASHKIAIRYKELSIPICGRKCSPYAHSSYVSPPACANAFTALAKSCHGYHCALYDCVELYFQHILF